VVSRADFILALWHLLPSIEAGNIGSILLGVFQIFGGHVVAYTRLFQLANYWLFDYSPLAVKYAGMVTFGLAWLAFAYLARRALGSGIAAAILILLATGLICSPVTYGLISWPDAILPYYSSFIALSLLLAHVCRWMERTRPLDLLWVLLAGFAVICGSGVGWAVVPTFVLAAVIAKGHVDSLVRTPRWPLFLLFAVIALSVAIVLLRLVILHFMTTYQDTLYLDEARASLAGVVEHPGLATKFFFAVLATNVLLGSVEDTYGFGVVALLFWLCLMLRGIVVGETRRLNVWISFSVFGLLSVLLTALTRWGLMIKLGLTLASQYYSVFALPFHLGTLGLGIALARRDFEKKELPARMTGFLIIVATAAFVIFGAVNLFSRHTDYLRAARDGATLNAASLRGAAGRNLLLLSEFAGSPQFVEMYLFGVMRDFKRVGKYPALTANYIEDAAAFAVEHQIQHPLPREMLQPQLIERCLPRYGDARLAIAEPDRRRVWRSASFNARDNAFVRFSGYAINSSDCSRSADFVLAVDREGRVLCISRPGLENASTLHERFLPPVARRGATFDFSCPIGEKELSARRPFTVLSYFANDGRLEAIPFDDRATDRLAVSAELISRDGIVEVLVDGKPAKQLEERAGWAGAGAGRRDGDFFVFDGWAIDRSRSRTAAAILLFKGERLVYAAEPTVPFPKAEQGVALVHSRRAGFRIAIPVGELSGTAPLRIFALTDQGEVSEVYYPQGFPKALKP
jgi:hypothetical protein